MIIDDLSLCLTEIEITNEYKIIFGVIWSALLW